MKRSLILSLVFSVLLFGVTKTTLAYKSGDEATTMFMCRDLAAAVEIAKAGAKSDEAGAVAAKEHINKGNCGLGPPVDIVVGKEYKVGRYSVWGIKDHPGYFVIAPRSEDASE